MEGKRRGVRLERQVELRDIDSVRMRRGQGEGEGKEETYLQD